MRAFEHVLDATRSRRAARPQPPQSLARPAGARPRAAAPRSSATLHDYTLVCPSGGQRIHKAEHHVCHTIEPERCARCFAESPFFSQMASAGSLTAPRRRALAAPRSPMARAGAPGWPRAGLGTAAHRSARAVTPRPRSRRVSTPRAPPSLQFDLVVAPSAALAREFQRLGCPGPHRLRVLGLRLRPLTGAPPSGAEPARCASGSSAPSSGTRACTCWSRPFGVCPPAT